VLNGQQQPFGVSAGYVVVYSHYYISIRKSVSHCQD